VKPIPVIAVFDIGKTNKKFFLFDEDYNIVFETSAHLNETIDDDGDPCEDINALTRWILRTFDAVKSKLGFDIRWLNFSTYGASFVHIGNDGLPVGPLYNYLKPFPEDLKSFFYSKYGGEMAFAKSTASPVLGSLNSGMILYFLKHRKPWLFRDIRYSLHLPQYVSSLFTGSYYSDLTSIGCHTNLWDFQKNAYHEWVGKEGVLKKLAPVVSPTMNVEIQVVHKIMYSGTGLHDSSSALIPYLIYSDEEFLLLSTGTWCISLNPFNDEPLTASELKQDCLCYLTYQGRPVKASRLFSGHYHEEKCRTLSGRFGVAEDAYKTVQYIDKIENENSSFEHAYNALMRELVKQQIQATNLVLQSSTKNIYVDGGFSQNRIFMKLLADAYPDRKVYGAEVKQASALGAAMIVHGRGNNLRVTRDILKLTPFGDT
jgi:sugar (pentulose or hexulose) kinase